MKMRDTALTLFTAHLVYLTTKHTKCRKISQCNSYDKVNNRHFIRTFIRIDARKVYPHNTFWNIAHYVVDYINAVNKCIELESELHERIEMERLAALERARQHREFINLVNNARRDMLDNISRETRLFDRRASELYRDFVSELSTIEDLNQELDASIQELINNENESNTHVDSEQSRRLTEIKDTK